MIIDKALDDFVNKLASTAVDGNTVYNQYSFCESENEIRRNNLYLYLSEMREVKPKMLLVGEAPGYKGCRVTGIPFTSEYIMVHGIPDINLFGKLIGYKPINKKHYEKENTATMVWEALTNAGVIPLLWNSFPFHPFNLMNHNSNRKPTKAELSVGQEFLERIIEIYKIKNIIAVGNEADDCLRCIGISCTKIRHPSHGGKTDFVNGLYGICNSGVLS